ncbi:MAG: hypothetical protein ACI8RZ_002124 [Myxococcota bacterium]|jgi:hypothetical protein
MVRRLIAAITAGVVLTTWPMARHPMAEGMGIPGLEGPDHLWSLWAGMQDGPVVIDTALVNFPAGLRWVLVDPLNLLWFVPGDLLGGSGLGWNLVVAGSLAIIGLAAALWCRRLDPTDDDAPAVAALLAITAAPVAGSLLTGMSEAMTMGWLVLALLALARLDTDPRWRAAILAGVMLGLTAWAGPYTAIYTALATPPILAMVLWRGRAAILPRLGLAVGIGGLLAAPILRAVLWERPEGLPGSSSGLPEILAAPGAAKNLMLGADPVGLVWPIVPVEPLHAVFLGTLLLPLALLSLRRSTVLLAAAGILVVFGLGFFLQHSGALWGSAPIALPAAWVSLKIEALGRAIRWHRAIIPAAILLCVPAALTLSALTRRLGSLRPVLLVGITGLMIADSLLRAPLPWPRHTFPIAPPDGYAQLSEGPILPLPLSRFTGGSPEQLRSTQLLWQTTHGLPIGGNPRQPGEAFSDRAVTRAAQDILDGDASGVQAAADLGFAWILVARSRDADRLTTLLGPPDVTGEDLWAWSLRSGDDG